jgi:transcriptional regulator with GAF, ATPase, and Fis domain
MPILAEAIKALEEVGDLRMCAEALAHLGVCEIRLLIPGSHEHMERARQLARKSGHIRQEVYALISLSDYHHRAGDEITAQQTLEEARDLAASVHPSPMLSFVLGTQANACIDNGRFDRAIQLAREAEDHAWHFADVDSAVYARNTAANAALLGGRPAEASAMLRRILEEFTNAAEPRRINITRLTHAEALMESPDADLKLAGELIHEATESCRRRGDSMGVLSGLVIELERRARHGCTDPIEPIKREYRALLAQRSEDIHPELRMRAEFALAEHALSGGDTESARREFEELVKQAEEAGSAWMAARAYGLLADTLSQQGREQDAALATRRGRTALREAAERIVDEDLRRDFLQRPAFHRLRDTSGDSVPVNDPRLLALYDMIRALNSESDPENLLNSIVDMALEVVRADRGMILLRESERADFRVRVARNVEAETEQDAEAFSHSIVSQAGEGRSIMAIDAGTDERFRDLRSVSLFKIRSLMCVPLRSRGRIVGTVYLDSRSKGRVFKKDDLRFVEAFADHAALALENARARARLETENRRLQVVAEERVRFDNIVGRSSVMQKVFDMIEKVAQSELPVLIQGESGTGKELVARSIHFHSTRKRKLIMSENCAAIPESLLESALFGHVRGAFTGAEHDRVGLFEQADGCTLFLDEVGDMSPAMQARLLRVLEDGEVRRVGGESSVHVDVRLLTATNRDLQERVEKGLFREDLLYRLQVLTIQLPALRERHGDIPLLVSHMLERIARERDRDVPIVDPDVLEILERYPWPGNVRQLENVLQRLALLAGDDAITRSLIEEEEALRRALLGGLGDDEPVFSLERSEREQIRRALESCGGNRNRAAKLLGISRATIYRKIKEYDLR